MWESVNRAIVFLQEKSLVIDWGCSTWDNCQNKTAWTVHDIYEWGIEEAGERWKRAEERKSGKMEEWGWPVRWGERKNFSMMKQSVLLSYWPTLPPIAGPAPWQQALSPREKQPYRTTPPDFSLPFTLMIPSPFPIYKRAGFTSVRARQHKPNTPSSTIHQMEGQHTRNPQCFSCYIHRFNGAHTVEACTAFPYATTGLKTIIFLITPLKGCSVSTYIRRGKGGLLDLVTLYTLCSCISGYFEAAVRC